MQPAFREQAAPANMESVCFPPTPQQIPLPPKDAAYMLPINAYYIIIGITSQIPYELCENANMGAIGQNVS
jgi:hypothetical protein